MMVVFIRMLGIMSIGLLVTACSGTQVSSSWSNPDFKGKVKNVYLIGIAKNDFNRMYFENTFYRKLGNEEVKAIPSSTDLPKNQETDRQEIIQKMKANGCDSVLLTRVIDQQTKATITSGKGSYSYASGPTSSGVRPSFYPYYSNWSNYYTTSYQVVYQQPTTTKIIVLTVESVLYDLKTEELIWTAQMETGLEGNFEQMVEKFVDKAVMALKEKGLI